MKVIIILSCVIVVGAILAALLADLAVKMQLYTNVYDQRPGQCWHHAMNGSEDIILLPNNHAIVSSGLQIPYIKEQFHGRIYMLDMTKSKVDPVSLKFEDSYFEDNPNFNPHGISYWHDEDGQSIYLYIISHWIEDDSIEVFLYKPDSLSLKHVKSIRDPLIVNINNLIVTGFDQFYTTQWMYYKNKVLHQIEQIFQLPLTNVLYYDGKKATIVATGLKQANGINKSRNDKFIYVVNMLNGEIIAYTRNADNSLTPAQSYSVPYIVDNLSVDNNTGHLWAAVFIKPLEFYEYALDHSHHVPCQTLHITVNEESDRPFDNSKVEVVFQSTVHGAISTALYTNNILLLGTVFDNLTICEVNYLMN